MADGEKRIIELEELTTLTDNDYIAVDNSASGGKTKKFKPKRLSDAITDLAETTEETIDGVIEETDSKFDEALALGTASGSIASFTDGSTLPMKKLEVDIEPVQDLHGYDSPWVGGSGKNKLQVTATSKSENGLTFTVNADGSMKINGTATAYTELRLNTANPLKAGTYIVNGVVDGSGVSKRILVRVGSTVIATDTGSGAEFTLSEDTTVVAIITVSNGVTINNATWYPMIRLSSVTDATWQPYSNICPISGWDECKVSKYKAYQICETTSESVTNNGVTMSYLGNGKYRVKGSLATNSSATLALSIKPFTIYDGGDSYISFSNTYASAYLTQRFLKGNSVLDTWGLTTVNRTSSYSGLRGKETDKFDLVVNSALYGTELDFTFRIVFYSNTEKETYTIDLDGTRYGGTLDVVSGTLVVDRVGVDMATLNWTNSSSNHRSYCYDIKTLIKIPSSQSVKSGCITEKYFEIPSTGSLIDGEFAVTQSGDLIFYYDGINPPSGQLVYPLATPQTIQLTPTEVKSLLATNNVFADTGDILDATYVRNANITINDLIRRIEALES